MNKELNNAEIIKELESFLGTFRQLGAAIENKSPDQGTLMQELQRVEPRITAIIVRALGHGHLTRFNQVYGYKDLLANTLNWRNFTQFESIVESIINRTIGTVQAGLLPPKFPNPMLIIHDDTLRDRCADLLSAPKNYDRVVREATTVLEDRIRTKTTHGILSRVIPHSADQVGENLINKLLNASSPILSISEDKHKRIEFQKILIGVFSYLRNPYHHELDDQTEWSWAWSVVGLVDQLLADLESCSLSET